MIYLYVPFEQKDDAKSMGAKWDPEKKLWYAPDESFKQLIEKYSASASKTTRVTKKTTSSTSSTSSNSSNSGEPPKPLVLIGENRRFGGNELYVDILPKGSNISLRRLLSDNDFYRLKNLLVKRVAYRCECCGEECISSERKYLEVCEMFSFNFSTKVQRLERLASLCKKCYQTTRLIDKGVALEHLMYINGLDRDDAKHHIYEAFDSWKARSEIKWTVDLSIITNSGLQLGNPKKDGGKQTDTTKSSPNSKITINKIGGSSRSSSNSSNSGPNSNSSNTNSNISNSSNSSKPGPTDTKKITINKITSKKEQCMFEDD
jgi:hypothetical protein